MSTHNICFHREIRRIIYGYPLLSVAMQGYSKIDKQEPLLYWMNVQADLSLSWSHRSYCRFCRYMCWLIYKCLHEMSNNIWEKYFSPP